MDVSGLWVPLVTPFDERGAVALDALRALAGEVLDDGADGLVALATTAESTALDDGERAAIIRACSEVCADRGAPLMVGAGTADTRSTLERHAALADVPGVVASLCVVPYYVCPGEVAATRHVQHVADRSPVPVVVYNIPYRSGCGQGSAALLELAATDGVVGVKQAVGGVDADTLRLLAAPTPGFTVLCGDDPYLFALAILGAGGGITASALVATAEFAALLADVRAGRVADGRARSQRLLPLVEELFAEPNPVMIKARLHAQGRIPTPKVRMPLRGM